MRAVITRVASASVSVGGKDVARIGHGLLVLLGVAGEDTTADVRYVAQKTAGLRIFGDEHGRMNLSIGDTGGEVLVVSQFTLLADVRRGRRPSFVGAARPEQAQRQYEEVVALLRESGLTVSTGVFQADMLVSSVNDGPVTIILDSHEIEESKQ